MAVILPPPSTPQPLPTASPAAVVTVPSPPPALAQLPAGALVRAEIIQILTRGLVEARTDFGIVQLRTSLPFTEGMRLELQLLKTLPQAQFTMRRIDSRGVLDGPPRVAVPALGQSLSPASVAAPATPPASLANLVVGAIVRAVVTTPGGNTQTSAAPAPTPAPAGAFAPSNPSVAANVSATPNAFTPGAQLQIRIAAILPPGPSPSASAAAGPAPSNVVNGTVTALTPDGRPVVQTTLGLITLVAVAAETRVGTQLQFILAPPARPLASSSPQSFPDNFVERRAWPALEEAVNHLAQRAAPPGTQPAVPALPQANSRLAANLMLFMAALKGGSVNAWLGGDAAEVLERERPELARRIGDEFAQLARAFNEAPADDWRTAILPYYNGAHLEPIQMHIRNRKAREEDGSEDEGSRFIIDVELSRLGRIQLDGFIKTRGSDHKTFDLIVRTDKPLPQPMRLDINRIFNDFGEAAGIVGAIAFQARTRFVEVSLARVGERVKDGLIV